MGRGSDTQQRTGSRCPPATRPSLGASAFSQAPWAAGSERWATNFKNYHEHMSISHGVGPPGTQELIPGVLLSPQVPQGTRPHAGQTTSGWNALPVPCAQQCLHPKAQARPALSWRCTCSNASGAQSQAQGENVGRQQDMTKRLGAASAPQMVHSDPCPKVSLDWYCLGTGLHPALGGHHSNAHLQINVPD